MNIKYKFPPEFFEESTASFVIDKDRKRLWAALLDLLAEFDRVCRKHGIKYSIDGGTMLGKARHNGIIPWDDDIDVIIMRSEYEELKKVAADEFKDPYFLQTMESDPEALRRHPILRNSSMSAFLRDQFKDGKAIYKSFNQGLSLDIFVLESIPDDAQERENYFKELSCLVDKMYAARNCKYKKLTFGLTPRRLLDFIRLLKSKYYFWRMRRRAGLDPMVYLQSLFEKACRRYEGMATKDVSHLLFEPNPKPSRIFERNKVLITDEVDFMGLKVQMLRDWRYYLSHLYGNWQKYIVGGAQHGSFVIDLDHPYTYYF